MPEPWDLVSEGYAAEAGAVMAPFSERAAELLAPNHGARILDVACGPGTLSLAVAPRVREVVALDFSSQMLVQLEQRASSAGIRNLRAVSGDGQALPFGDDEFDAGFSIFGLMFFPDRAQGFRELLRVLKPGAGAVVSSWAPLDEAPLMKAMFGALAAADPAFMVPPKSLAGLENPDVLSGEMSAAGFERVRIEPVTVTLQPRSADELWLSMARSSAPLVLMRKRLGEAEWQRRDPIIRAHLAQVLATDPSLSTTAWLAVGYKPA